MDIRVADIVTWSLDSDANERTEPCRTAFLNNDTDICIGIVTAAGTQVATVKWMQRCMNVTHAGNRYEVLGAGLLQKIGQI